MKVELGNLYFSRGGRLMKRTNTWRVHVSAIDMDPECRLTVAEAISR